MSRGQRFAALIERYKSERGHSDNDIANSIASQTGAGNFSRSQVLRYRTAKIETPSEDIIHRFRDALEIPQHEIDALLGVVVEPVPTDHGLKLSRPWETSGRRTRISPATALKPARGIVPFDGRKAELASLKDWCAGDGLRLRVYHAGGGMGKTRLMMEAAEQLAAQGWQTGFLDSGAEVTDALIAESLRHYPRLLIIIDYAETRTNDVRKLIKAMDTETAKQLRLVLLARSLGTWYETLASGDDHITEFVDDSTACETLELPALINIAHDRQAEFFRAQKAFRTYLADQPGLSEASSTFQAQTPDLSAEGFRRVLAIHIAAYIAATGERVENADKALHSMVGHERKYWKEQWQTLHPQQQPTTQSLLHLDVAAALATLAGTMTHEQAVAVYAHAPLLQKQTEVEQREIADFLGTTYPTAEEQIGAVEPDLIGEQLIEDMLNANHVKNLLFDIAFHPVQTTDALVQAFAVFMRLTARRGTLGDWAADLERVMGPLLANPDHPPLAQRWSDLLPRDSVAFLSFAVEIQQAALNSDDKQGVERLIRELGDKNKLSVRLGDAGRREDALALNQEVVEGYRLLASLAPDAFNPDLAASLNNLANRLSELGQRQEALTAIKEAVKLRRQLAQQNPDAFNPNLAMALNNLSRCHSDLGQRQEALTAIKEAVEILRRLANQNPDAFNPDLAASLNNLSAFLSNLGQRQEALSAIKEAVELRRQLAKQNPDAFNPDLAASLNNLSTFLSNLGQRQEALTAIKEAVELRRQLAKQNPDAFNPELAGSLNNLSNCHSNLGQRQEALTAIKEAVEILRQLANQNPDAFNPDLAMSVSVMSDQYAELGHKPEAHEFAREAICLLTPYFQALPMAHAHMMGTYAQDYLKRCEEAEIEPDMELLAPILAVFQAMQQGQGDASGEGD